MTLEPLNLSDFSPHLYSQFSLYYDEENQPLTLDLIEICELSTERLGDLGQSFSLVFRHQSDTAIPQKIYQLKHDRMGDLNIFLVPIGPDQKGMRYEAIFN